jgi:hypothetical protein|tara:strand:- start:211 stop:435 length:225 start_codon:yes stop_codon:yes gene_type:complete
MENLKDLVLKLQSKALEQGEFFRLNACQEHLVDGCGFPTKLKPAERKYEHFCWKCHDNPNSKFYNLKPRGFNNG